MRKRTDISDQFWYRYWRYVVHVRERMLARPDTYSVEQVYWAGQTLPTARELLALHADRLRHT